jgi:hypothetical protein
LARSLLSTWSLWGLHLPYTFHSTDMPHFAYALTSFWTFVLFPIFMLLWIVLPWTLMYRFLYKHVSSFLRRTSWQTGGSYCNFTLSFCGTAKTLEMANFTVSQQCTMFAISLYSLLLFCVIGHIHVIKVGMR